jgi:hypothetical protein
MGKSTKMGPGGNMGTNNNSTNIFNMYTSGSGVGASSIANHRAKNRLATENRLARFVSGITPTILVYNTDQGSSVVWYGVTFTLDTSLPNSYTAITTSIPASTVPNPGNLIGLTIGNSVTSIGEYAFFQCSSLTSIIIPNSVTSISLAAFAMCSALISITIPNSVTSIATSAFQACSKLASVIFAPTSTLGSIGNIAFFQCYELTSITIPNSVTSINVSAFKECSALASVILPTNALFTTISDETFKGCTSLTSITIPNSVTSIGADAFLSSGLTSVTISTNPQIISGITFTSGTTVAFFGKTGTIILYIDDSLNPSG